MRLDERSAGREVEIRSVSKSYHGHLAVDNVSLRLQPGEVVAILGPSGSGKTTLLGMLGGRLAIDAGDILIGGRSIAGLPPERIDAATVFQDYALFPHMSVLENVASGLRVRNLPKDVVRERALAMLDVVGLRPLADRNVLKLSGGQRQRVATARALAINPGIILLDEPLGALDRQIRSHLQAELSGLLRRLHVTALLVTHDQEEAFAMADRVAIMRDGKLQQIGKPNELYAWPQNEFVATFLGKGTILEGRVESQASDTALVAVSGGVVIARAQGAPGNVARILVRPEDVEIVEPGSASDATWKSVTVSEVFETGGTTQFKLSVEGQDIEALHLGSARVSVGQVVDCKVGAHRAVVIPS